MKKIILIMAMFACIGNNIKSQTQWTMMDTSLSSLEADATFIIINNNIPYVCYADNYMRATVKKFDGNYWTPVGIPAFSGGIAYHPTMAFNNTGTPYVAYTDPSHGNGATVMKFDGTNWVPVGNPGFTPGAASYTSIAIDSNGTPYVAFRDFAHNLGASVMKFDGNSWVFVGTPGFSHPVMDQGGALSTTISFDKNGNLYLAYSDFSNNFLASVAKFDGNDWVYVGAHGFSHWNAEYGKSMCFDTYNTPYIVCSVNSKATVMKFDGTNWVALGSPAFSQGYAGYASIAIDNNNTIYVGYEDYANGHKASAMKYDGNNWVTIGNAGFSPTQAGFTSIAVDALGNVLVAFKDYTPFYYNTYPHYRAKVMKFENNNATVGIPAIENNNLFTVYPNPTGNIFTVCYKGDCKDVVLTIKNNLGQIIRSKKYSSQKELKESFDLSGEGKGVYSIEVVSGEVRKVKKVVIE